MEVGSYKRDFRTYAHSIGFCSLDMLVVGIDF